jgi:hypothetical protein
MVKKPKDIKEIATFVGFVLTLVSLYITYSQYSIPTIYLIVVLGGVLLLTWSATH